MKVNPPWPDGWQALGDPPPASLAAPRRQLHRAALVAAAVGNTLLDPEPDDSHRAFVWFPGMRAMAQRPVEGAQQPFHVALRPEDLDLIILSEDNVRLAELPLSGRPVGKIFGWLEEEVEGHLGRPLPRPLERPEELGDDDRFSRQPPAAFAELGRYFANAYLLLEHAVAPLPGAAPVRVWPHHFDMAALIALGAAEEGGDERSIGVGLMPGDGADGEPYLYVNLWPHPDLVTDELPAPPAGAHWNTDGWLGLVLPAAQLVAAGGAVEQARLAERFAVTAIAACRELLGAG